MADLFSRTILELGKRAAAICATLPCSAAISAPLSSLHSPTAGSWRSRPKKVMAAASAVRSRHAPGAKASRPYDGVSAASGTNRQSSKRLLAEAGPDVMGLRCIKAQPAPDTMLHISLQECSMPRWEYRTLDLNDGRANSTRWIFSPTLVKTVGSWSTSRPTTSPT